MAIATVSDLLLGAGLLAYLIFLTSSTACNVYQKIHFLYPRAIQGLLITFTGLILDSLLGFSDGALLLEAYGITETITGVFAQVGQGKFAWLR